MLKGYLKSIKDDLWNVLSAKKYVQRAIKERERELKAYLKEQMARNAEIYGDSPFSLDYHNRLDKERVDHLLSKAVTEISGQYHNDQSYHLIYKDGSEACITAEEILLGEPFPKVSDVVYAELSDANENYDTETGELNFHSDDGDYDAEDERRWQYDAAIEIKYGTKWGIRWMRNHPDFVPVAL